jgi:hypothetical protein
MPAVPIGEELFREVFDHLPLHDLPEHDGRALQARQRLSDRIVDVQNDGALGEIAKPAICAKMRNRCGQLRRDFQQPDARQVEERGVELDFARTTLVRLGRVNRPCSLNQPSSVLPTNAKPRCLKASITSATAAALLIQLSFVR